MAVLGERSDQRGLWEAERLYLDHVGREGFYGLLASLRGRLFRDADFAGFYCPDNGRDKDLEGHLVLASLATNPVSQGLNSSSDGSLTR